MIFFWAKANPERPAIIQADLIATYQQLAQAIDSIADRLDKLDLNNNQPVAVAINHPFSQLAVCFALLRRGIACSPVGSGTVPYLRSNGIHTLIYALQGFVGSGGRNIRFDRSWLRRANEESVPPKLVSVSRAVNTNMIFFTSGTTGLPKKVVLPSGIFSERRYLLPVIGECNFTRFLVVPGLHSSYGFVRTAMTMVAGRTACFASGFDEQLKMIDLFRIEAIVASPQQVLGLVETIEKGARCRIDTLKEIRIAGGYCSKGLIKRVKSALNCRVSVKYGATEAGVIALADADSIPHAAHAVGFLVPGVEVEIVDENGRTLPQGEEGIIRCRSGYHAKVFAATNPERAQSANEAWWYPGDIGSLSEEGLLCITSRSDDLINSGGVKIAAGPLDEAIRQFPGIQDAGVCAVRGRSGIEEVWIGIVPKTGIDTQQLVNSIKNSRDLGVIVGEVKIVDRIPRNDLGKLQRGALKKLLASMRS
jgi:acyl-coenzyme A synthetase/AMP-(fatty) acid ligase